MSCYCKLSITEKTMKIHITSQSKRNFLNMTLICLFSQRILDSGNKSVEQREQRNKSRNVKFL